MYEKNEIDTVFEEVYTLEKHQVVYVTAISINSTKNIT